MPGRTITSICLVVEESPVPLYVGREDGSVDHYVSPDAACCSRAALTFYGHTKAVTAIVAPSLDEVYTCSMDGSVRQWSPDRELDVAKRCLQVSWLPTPLRCLAMNEGILYTGGDDGCLHLIEGTRSSSWSGHKDALSCIAFGPEDSQLIITGGYDNQIRVWDAKLGKTIRLLIGHLNHVKCLRIAGGGELLFSFGRDLTMKIWRLPEHGDEAEEEAPLTPSEANRHATVSFQEPTDSKNTTNNNSKTAEAQEAQSDTEPPPDNEPPAAVDQYRAAAQLAAGVKSALKARPDPPIRQLYPVGTIEIPEAPHVVAAIRDEAAYCYVGTSDGYVLGINARALSRSVLQFLSRNAVRVRADTRETRTTLRLATRAIKRRCKKAIQLKQRELLRIAKKARAVKKAEERKERAAARAVARAEKAAARAAEDDEEDEEEDEEEAEEDPEEDEQQEEDEEDEQEEEDEDPLALLDDTQREELKTFRQEQEKERDDEITKLRDAATERKAVVGAIAAATYDTARDQFFRLSFTSYKKIGSEAVQAVVVAPGGVCCAAQSDRIVAVDITPGITYL
ncbi:serine/threonine protein kinase [Trypanosoma grayi]|uniref:serine/threonine protein kinase n=1 Tax=Trypanosoma grayi TaxID=71804 RepID=UPI0004F4812B|nr:serine/threonine protein kinase [Trypanosoma grayi]KEG08439.1 serine/threonine protein kinase [Trypanosoma grayi]